MKGINGINGMFYNPKGKTVIELFIYRVRNYPINATNPLAEFAALKFVVA
jgi:hypothetical protein